MAQKIINGLGVSEGIRIGKAFLYKPAGKNIEVNTTAVFNVENELARFALAKEKSLLELDQLIEKTRQNLGKEKAAILKGQQSFLADPTFCPEMEKLIINNSYFAEKAVNQVTQQFITIFESMPNEYMRERAADIRDVGQRLIAQLSGEKGTQLSEINEEVILIAEDLTPSDTVQLDKTFILGFVTKLGGKTSHTAILSRSLGIPAILGLGDGVEAINDGENLIIDGTTGLCILNPDQNTLKEYRKKQVLEQEEKQFLQVYANKPAITKDGFQVEIAANIGTVEEAKAVIEQGAEGIGLYRTEFLFMSRQEMPDEEVQFQAYKEVLEIMGEKPVVIRTLDIGGDKELPYLQFQKELNPFLGYRAIRLSLDKKELLVTQLRAILRASIYGNAKIMFPMISSIEEWRQAKEIYEESRLELQKEGVTVNHAIELGIMVEIPSAALLAKRFAKEVDFFSIGTNDLVQYTLAVDRMNEKVAYLYDHFHPAVINLLKEIVDAAHAEGKWVGMCGGMAGDPLAVPLLLALGLDELSMSGTSLQKVKQVISRVDRSKCLSLFEEILEFNTTIEIREALKKFDNKFTP